MNRLLKVAMIITACSLTTLASQGKELCRKENVTVRLILNGYGTAQLVSSPDCASLGKPCVQEVTGNFNTALGLSGQLATHSTAKWDQSVDNHQGGYCAPMTTVWTLTLKGGTIRLAGTGTLCEIGASVAGVPEQAFYHLVMTKGTGIYSKYTGYGIGSGAVNAGPTRQFADILLTGGGNNCLE